MKEDGESIRMYSIPFRDRRISELITWYVKTLQKAIDFIWNNITWEYNFKKYREGKYAKVKVPVIPKGREFKRNLRNMLMENNPYANHWVDSVIRTAYSIMDSWRKRYVRGKARKRKPEIRRRFARCKITLMRVYYEKKNIRITLRPNEYVEIGYDGAWFEGRIKGWKIGE